MAAILGLLAVATPMAENLPDPTQPPAGVESVAASEPTEKASPQSGLQSVILRKSGKSAAIINGNYVEQGEKFGDATLVKVAEDHVILRTSGGREALRMSPAAEKKVHVQDIALGKKKPTVNEARK